MCGLTSIKNSSSPLCPGDCSKIKLENALMECLIENSSEVGLVTDELFHRLEYSSLSPIRDQLFITDSQ